MSRFPQYLLTLMDKLKQDGGRFYCHKGMPLVMHVFKREHSQGAKGVPSRKLWHALHAIDKYLRGQARYFFAAPVASTEPRCPDCARRAKQAAGMTARVDGDLP